MRFGSLDLFMDFGDWNFRMGRPLANEGFLKALLTHGRFDTYQFFCPDVHHLQKFQEGLKQRIPDPHLRKRVQASLQAALAETLREEEFQAFHLGDFTYAMPQLVGLRNRAARAPFPVTGVTHSIDALFMNTRYLELLLAGPAPFDGIVCTSRSAQAAVEKGLSWVQRRMEERTGASFPAPLRSRVIPLGIDESFFGETDRGRAGSFFRLPPESVVALFVGRLSLRQKNDWAPTLELFARMEARRELGNLILILAGGGQESDVSLLEKAIGRLGLRERVLLFPNFSPEVKEKLYQAADLFLSVVDNFQETFGLSVLEAMASGLPVIVSDFSGYRDFVTEGEEGFLIPTTWTGELPEFLEESMGVLDPSLLRLYLSQTVAVDQERLRAALLCLAKDPGLRIKMGRAARARAQSFRWPKLIPAYEEFWAELRAESQSRAFQPARGPDILKGDYCATYSHFPSRRISPRQELGLTEWGRQIAEGSAAPTRYEDVQVCLFPDLERLLLSSLLNQPRSLTNLRTLAQEALQATAGQVDFHVLWLLKHGALRLE